MSYRSYGLALLGALGLLPSACKGEHVAPCTSDEPLVVDGQDTGFATCEEGVMHRPQVIACPSLLPRASTSCSDIEGGPGACREDSDCLGANAFCELVPGPGGGQCECSNGCVSDLDCGPGTICQCTALIGFCVAADCTVDAQCGELKCVQSELEGSCALGHYACQSEDDECAVTANCPEGQRCVHDGSARVCADGSFCASVGRPFLVGEVARTAGRAWRGDWTHAAALPCLAGVTMVERDALAAHWTAAALLEHASIAAFARFALQLMALGAPAELLEQTEQAMADEIRHARLCFAFASAYAGRALGPSVLSLEGAVDNATDAATVVRLTFREGCVGETVAALAALEAARGCRDAIVAQALERIAADELRHAELAWRFVKWALAQDAALAAVLADELRAIPRTIEVVDEGEELLAHGALGGAGRAAVHTRALSEVVTPVAQALLSQHARERCTGCDRSTPPAQAHS